MKNWIEGGKPKHMVGPKKDAVLAEQGPGCDCETSHSEMLRILFFSIHVGVRFGSSTIIISTFWWDVEDVLR